MHFESRGNCGKLYDFECFSKYSRTNIFEHNTIHAKVTNAYFGFYSPYSQRNNKLESKVLVEQQPQLIYKPSGKFVLIVFGVFNCLARM